MTRLILMSSGLVPTSVMILRIDTARDEVVLQQQLLDLGHRQPLRVLGGVIVKLRDPSFALHEILAIVEITVVRAYSKVPLAILSPGTLLAREERLVQLLAVPRADDLHRALPIQDLHQGRRQIAHGRGGRFLDEKIPL